MKKLPLPSAADDLDYLDRLCRSAPWTPHLGLWQSAYGDYRRNKGNPWKLKPKSFVPDVSAEQRALYKNRADTSWVSTIRHASLQSCPMCGSPVTGSVDHYLPKEEFPEFAMMAANLVPACIQCNSGAKGRTFQGSKPAERFIHPYFDAMADGTLWYTRIVPPFPAASFEAKPMPQFSGRTKARIVFHLENVLGPQFHRSAENWWATFPQYLRDEVGTSDPITVREAKYHTARSLRTSILTSGVNSWKASFLRGILSDVNACRYLCDCTRNLQVTPLPKFC